MVSGAMAAGRVPAWLTCDEIARVDVNDALERLAVGAALHDRENVLRDPSERANGRAV